MNIGIDKLGFYTPSIKIDMRELALARDTDPDKYTYGLGQDFMSVVPITQDTISMAANAAYEILDQEDRDAIDLVILGTESSLDHSKSGATVIHRLLGINPRARAIEMKQACYGATAAMQMAKAHIALNPTKKALILASDISRYGLYTKGEPTQGAGAVAILISADPKIMVLENKPSYFTGDIYDFHRPNYSKNAVVDGKYSNEQYLKYFDLSYQDFLKNNEFTLEDFSAFCFHIPHTKIGLKALRSITDDETLHSIYQQSIQYNRHVGNIYNGSLFLNLISLLDHVELKENDRIGLYSYGSGVVAEFFSGILQKDYKDHLQKNLSEFMKHRTVISIPEYEYIYGQSLVEDGSHQILDTTNDDAHFKLCGINNHQRIYNY